MRKNGFISAILMIIIIGALIGLGFCLWKFVPKLLEYKASDDTFNTIKKEAVKDYDLVMADKLYDLNNSETEAEDENESEYVPDLTNAIGIDWEAFAGTDIVAWFQMDDISYPVMQSEDNEYYLHRLPDGSYNYGGSLFLYSENSPMFTDYSSFIYGHNMNNGSMFGRLKNYVDAKYAGHKFYLYLPDGTRHTYQFFSVAKVPQQSQAYTWSFKDEESFMNWQEWMKTMSDFDCKMDKDPEGHFVTLSTCNGLSGTTHRLVVCGKEVVVDKLQEPASWYDGYKNDYDNQVSAFRSRADELATIVSEEQVADEEYIWDARHNS